MKHFKFIITNSMFTDLWLNIFGNLPKELIVFLVSMIPIAELRGALPIALAVFDFPLPKALAISIFGNMLPIIAVVYLLEPFSGYLMQESKFFNKFFNWLFARTRKKFEGKYKKYGKIALLIFVAMPLPITGAWTGSVAGFLFNIKPKQSLALIFIGVLIASAIVSSLTLGIINIF